MILLFKNILSDSSESSAVLYLNLIDLKEFKHASSSYFKFLFSYLHITADPSQVALHHGIQAILYISSIILNKQ